jgi:hypothetical protein
MRIALVLATVLLTTSACKTKRTQEQAIAETKEKCGPLLAADSPAISCDELGELMLDITEPFGDLSNEKKLREDDDAFITKCMDAFSNHYKRCEGNASYKKALNAMFTAAAK